MQRKRGIRDIGWNRIVGMREENMKRKNGMKVRIHKMGSDEKDDKVLYCEYIVIDYDVRVSSIMNKYHEDFEVDIHDDFEIKYNERYIRIESKKKIEENVEEE